MTARERLRQTANDMDLVAATEGSQWRKDAAALRALADRIDAEMRAVLIMEQETRDTNDAGGWGCAAAIAHTLARLDAPLDATPAPLGTPEVLRCASWCGFDWVREAPDGASGWVAGQRIYCTAACRDAGRPLHPATPGEPKP